MTSLLITGANGFIGSNLCRYFLDRGVRIYAFVRETSDLRFLEGLDVCLIRGDLRETEKIRMPDDILAVVHSASLVSDVAGEKACELNIFQATVNLVRKLQATGRPLRRFVYLSTALVLGYDGVGISEERPGQSTEFLPYTKQKKRTERFLLAEQAEKRLPVVILRPGDVYGPNDRTTCAQILRGCERGVPLIVGHGRWRFGYCYVGNLCQAVELAINREGIEGRAYTVTNGELPTWRDFFKAVQKGLGKRQRVNTPVWFAFAVARMMGSIQKVFPGYQPSLNYYRIKRITTETTYDISRTVAELGYRPDDNFEAQMAKIINWYLQERKHGTLA
jgi:nucleoside-diphosphate-sugar epimerase